MNLLIATGMVTKDPTYESGGPSGAICHFPLSLSLPDDQRRGRKTWFLCTVQGRQADHYVDGLWPGRMITVRANIRGTGDVRRDEAPIFADVSEIIFHNEDDQ